MKVLDRYIARLFLLNLVILGVVVFSLVVMMDLVSNFDEFVQAAQTEGEEGWARTRKLAWLIFDFYWPLMFLYAQYLVGLLPVGAAAFTLFSLNRNRELVAMLAGGVSLHRVAMPIIVMAFAANLLSFANQEWILPSIAEKVIRPHSVIKYGNRIKPFEVRLLPDTGGTLFTAGKFVEHAQDMHNVTILKRERHGEDRFGRAVERITADQAVWNEQRGGWELINGYRTRLDAGVDDSPETRRAAEIDFIATDLEPMMVMMQKRVQLRSLLSLGELSELIANPPRVVSVGELKRIRHARFSQMVINMLVLVMALPFFLLRAPENLFMPGVKMAGLCVGAWGGAIVMLQMPPGTLAPAVVAWLPVALYLPVAFYLMDKVET